MFHQTGSQREQAHKRKRPRLRLESWDAREQPSPEVCSQPFYVLICTVRMARRATVENGKTFTAADGHSE